MEYFLGGGAWRDFQERRSCELLPIFLQLRSRHRHTLPHPNYNNKDSTRILNPPATHATFHSLVFKGAYTVRVPVNGKCASVLAALALSTLFLKCAGFYVHTAKFWRVVFKNFQQSSFICKWNKLPSRLKEAI